MAFRAVADEIVVAGVRLPVAELRILDESSVKIKIAGTAEILPRKLAELKVIESTFSDPGLARRYPLPVIGTLASFAARSGAPGVNPFKVVMAAWLVKASELERAARGSSLRELLTNSEVVSALDRFPAGELARSDAGLDLLAELAIDSPNKFTLRVAGLGAQSVTSLSALIRSETLSAISMRNFARATNGVQALRSVDPSETSRNVAVFLQRLMGAIEVNERGGSTQGLFAISQLPLESDLMAVLAPFQVDAAHRSARAALSAGQAGEALLAIAKLPLERCTETTHSLVLESLERLSPDDGLGYLRDAELRDFLTRWSKVAPTIATALTAMVVRLGGELVRGSDPAALSELLSEYPVSDGENDALRRAQTKALLARGMLQGARESAGQIRHYSIIDSATFMWLGLDGGTLSALCYGLSLVLAIALLVIRIRRRRSPDSDSGGEQSNVRAAASATSVNTINSRYTRGDATQRSVDGDGERIASGAFSGFGVGKLQPGSTSRSEYRRLLAKFGLTEVAEVKDIKHAYRQRVKSVHPDLNPNVTSADRDEFIELTRIYERVLALRAELGLPS